MRKANRRREIETDESGLTPLGKQMIAGLDAFIETIESGTPIAERFTVRTVCLDPGPRTYKPEEVKAVRARFQASQAVFANFLGVSTATLQSWEQGVRPVPGIASRYLDDLLAFPEIWSRRANKAGESPTSSASSDS